MNDDKNKIEEVELKGILGEFREALRDEIAKIEKDGQSATLLKNGSRIASGTNNFWYRFKVEYIPSMPADTSCKLVISGANYNVTVIGVEEDEITLASEVELPETLASARLENGATVLIEKMIKRIEDNADKDNPAGLRMIPGFENSNTESFLCICDSDVALNGNNNPRQNDAVLSAVKNNITYIWGPPGTGKTTVIGQIIKQLYKEDRKVLVVSHTNTAVDGAIEDAQDLNTETECPVLRLGVPQKQLDEKVELRYQEKLLGKELFERKEALESQRDEYNKQVSEGLVTVSKIIWFNSLEMDALSGGVSKIEQLIEKKDKLYADYISASTELKRFKENNTEADKIKTLELQKDDAIKHISKLENQYQGIEEDIADTNDKISDLGLLLKRSSKRAELITELSRYSSEIDIVNSIKDQGQILTELKNEQNLKLSKKRTCEQTIANCSKNFLKSFLNNKKIASAKAELVDVEKELSVLAAKIDGADRLKVSYERQLASRKELQKKIDDLYIGKTEEELHNSLNQEQEKLLNYRVELRNKETEISVARLAVLKLEKTLASLRETNKILFSLIAKSKKTKKEFKFAEEALAEQQSAIDAMINIAIDNCVSFRGKLFEDATSMQEKFFAVKALYGKVASEIEYEDEELINEEIERARTALLDINKKLKDLEEKINDLERQVILNAKIIGATLAKSYLSDILQEIKFDTVILDEASMASIPALWCASYLAEKNIVIAGDFLQLPPIVMAETPAAKKWLKRDIFAVSGMQEKAKNANTKPANFVMLNEQFRMEKDIADIANLYYGEYGNLKSNDNASKRKEARAVFYSWFPRPKREGSVVLMDTSSLSAWVTAIPQGRNHTSRLNCFSATLDVEMAFDWIQEDVKRIQNGGKPLEKPKVLIVAPYKPHVERIKQLIKFEYAQRGIDESSNLIKAGTIHSFQGNEADIVIFDLVLDEPHWRANLFISDPEINSQLQKMFNVAVTRAKFKLVVVGNIKYCRQKAKNNALSELLDYLVDVQHFNVLNAKKCYPDLWFAKPRVFVANDAIESQHIICRDDTFYDYFLYDIQNFTRRMIIYSPFITSNRLSKLLPYFSDAINSGKEIIVVTKALSERKNAGSQYEALEKELINIGVKILHKKGMHEKLIFIDNDVVWMGSLNALSFSDTGEIMDRHCDKELANQYRSACDIECIEQAFENEQELSCPICHGEMYIAEGDSGIYWKCTNDDYSRNKKQQYPYDGVFRCHCGGNYHFDMKTEPRWVCDDNPRHYQKMREGDLKLELMASLIPNKKVRREVDKFFADKRKEREKDKPTAKSKSKNSSNASAKTDKKRVAVDDVIQLSLFD